MRSFVLAALSRARGGNSLNSTTKTISTFQYTATRRTFSSLPSLRPTVLASNGSVFRTSTPSSGGLLNSFTPTPSSTSGITLDLVPKTSMTAHPALAGCGAQIRCGPRATMARSSRLVRKRRHGFLSRVRSRNGRKTLQRRRDKKRSTLSM
ncbi:hypothetical protein GGS26DRAFT_559473 [Hypomontagnella submonticulosa]|nr:hypothetical protein GGS26DRAFT_559473 [Hypomontagnella submonticulosa]